MYLLILYRSIGVGRVHRFCCAMVEGEQREFHVVDIVENMGGINSNFFDLTTSNIANSNSNVENIVVDNVAVDNVARIEVV